MSSMALLRRTPRLSFTVLPVASEVTSFWKRRSPCSGWSQASFDAGSKVIARSTYSNASWPSSSSAYTSDSLKAPANPWASFHVLKGLALESEFQVELASELVARLESKLV